MQKEMNIAVFELNILSVVADTIPLNCKPLEWVDQLLMFDLICYAMKVSFKT